MRKGGFLARSQTTGSRSPRLLTTPTSSSTGPQDAEKLPSTPRDYIPRAVSMGALRPSNAQAAALGLGALAIRAVGGMSNILNTQRSPSASYAAVVKASSEEDLEELGLSRLPKRKQTLIIQRRDFAPDASEGNGRFGSHMKELEQSGHFYCYQFAEILYRWNLLYKRAAILKSIPWVTQNDNSDNIGKGIHLFFHKFECQSLILI